MLEPEALMAALGSLTAQRDREVLDRQAVGLIEALIDARGVAIHRCVGEPNDTRLLLRAARRRGEPPQTGVPGWTPIDELPRITTRPAHERAFMYGEAVLNQPAGSGGTGWLSVFPRRIDADRYGLIEIASDTPLSERARTLIEHLLRVYSNQLDLLDYSERDTLTGLMNRKTFDESFLKMLGVGDSEPGLDPIEPERRSAAESATHWLGVVDIDHFKSINDRFGHLIGDEVLLLVAQLLRISFRYGDRFYRFGGEEFVVVLQAPSLARAHAAFERFRRAMEGFRFPQAERVTASIGFTGMLAGDSASATIARADVAVYHCKGHGRNRVASHEELVATGAIEGAEDKVGDIELF